MIEKGKVFPVLDHGYVKFIDSLGTDETIVEAARMSTGKGFEGWEKDAKLLEYLYKNQHLTPFEMCELSVEVQAPIMVFREWHRHRTFSFNEMSGRYTVLPDLYYVPNEDRIQKQSVSNKQGSGDPFERQEREEVILSIRDDQHQLRNSYDSYIQKGVAREIARVNNPVSQYSRMRAKTDLRSWLHFLQLRMAGNAQLEIREYAYACAQIVKELWPRTWDLFQEYDLRAKKLSYREAEDLVYLLGYALSMSKDTSKDYRLTEKQTQTAWDLMRKLAT